MIIASTTEHLFLLADTVFYQFSRELEIEAIEPCDRIVDDELD